MAIYSTWALFHKYFVTMKCRWICSFFYFERKSTFNIQAYFWFFNIHS